MIKNSSSYSRRDSLRDIIRDNNSLLTVLVRFDISLGFGDSSVEKVCAENEVDCDTFLAVINFIGEKNWRNDNISVIQLINYLRRSHSRFLEYTLPNIKKTLIEGIHESKTSEIAMVILQFLDKYIDEVRAHMEYEDSKIFTYAENLIDGKTSDKFRIADFSANHEEMSSKLEDLKELFIYKYRQKNNEKINNALLQLIIFGKELRQHCEIENRMLFPHMEKLEKQLMEKGGMEDSEVSDSGEVLTDREKEVLRRVAQGLSTKEIADKMCLSVHTVNSHRKNIGAKLNIHSVTGLAIYAVLHNIIDINEIDLP